MLSPDFTVVEISVGTHCVKPQSIAVPLPNTALIDPDKQIEG